MLYTFVAAIFQHKDQTDNWQDLVRQELSSSQFFLEVEDRLYHTDDLIGFYQFIELEEGPSLFHGTPWYALIQECPSFLKLVGFFNWTHVASETLAKECLVPSLVQNSIFIARTDNLEFKRCARLSDLSLINLLSKFGFDDGAAFLRRDEEHLLGIYDKIIQCMQAAGLEGHVVLLETAHNPLQLSGDLYRDGKRVKDEMLALEDLSVTIWAYDWNILSDPIFWLD